MNFIIDYFFGKKVKFFDKRIGELSTRVKSNNPSVAYTWTGGLLFPKKYHNTVIILEGNCNGPYESQIHSIYKILDSYKELIHEIDLELKNSPEVALRFRGNWVDEFFIGAIMSYKYEKEKGDKFEICFEGISEQDTGYIMLIWDNEKIIELEAG